MSRFVHAFMSFWFTGVILIGGAIFVLSFLSMLRLITAGILTLIGMLVPIGMILFGIALLKFGWFLARNEREKLIDFLRQTLNARDA